MPRASDIYDVGDGPFAKCVFADVDGVVTNPTAVTATVKSPSGDSTTYTYGTDAEVERTSTGTYRIRVTFDEAGEWVVRFAGTGTIVAAAELIIRVRESAV